MSLNLCKNRLSISIGSLVTDEVAKIRRLSRYINILLRLCDRLVKTYFRNSEPLLRISANLTKIDIFDASRYAICQNV